MKILMVDDSRLDRRLLKTIFKEAGFSNEILESGDGEEGFDILNKNKEDIGLILLDWRIPKMDGLSFLQTASKTPGIEAIPIIIISSSDSHQSADFNKDKYPNLAGYIVKPYNKQELIEAVKPYI